MVQEQSIYEALCTCGHPVKHHLQRHPHLCEVHTCVGCYQMVALEFECACVPILGEKK